MFITYYDYLQEIYKKQPHKQRQKSIKRAQQQRPTFMITFTDKSGISDKYVKKSCADKASRLLLYSIVNDGPMDTLCELENIAGIVMYKQISSTKTTLRIYLEIICLYEEARGCGYGSMMMNELTQLFMEKRKSPTTTLEIVVLSLDETQLFYTSYGFKPTPSIYVTIMETYESEVPMLLTVYPDNDISSQ